MSKLMECRLLVEDVCREIRDSFEDLHLEDYQKPLVDKIKRETEETSPSVRELFRLLHKADLDSEIDFSDEEESATYQYDLVDLLDRRLRSLGAAERAELQLLQQESKTSAGLPSNASCH
jgi:hypothetical protein